jgi:tetratricopeptide (TPR) repeat protein
LALIAITVLVYLPVRNFPFIGFDDPGYVTENPHIAGGISLGAIRWAMTSGYVANWHPLTWISHMMDIQFFGMNGGAHHVTALVLHVANTLLLFFVFARMTGATGRSALLAALFAVHPMHVESVAWVAERKDVLSTFFWMLTMIAYVAYTRRPGWRRYAIVAVLFALGLMAKQMLVTLPCVLLLLDVWPLRRAVVGGSSRTAWARLAYEKLPLLGLSAAASVATFLAQRSSGAVQTLNAIPLSIRVSNAVLSYWHYIGKLVWPTDLAPLYPYPKTLLVGWVVAAIVGLIVVSIAVARAAKTQPYLPVGWLWFLGTLVPVIGIVQVGMQSMADRYTYVPSIGLFFAVIWGANDLLNRAHAPRAVGVGVSVATVVAAAILARQQVGFWRSGVALWEHTVAVTRDNYLALNNLGWDLALAGRPAEAIPHYQEAIRLNPKIPAPRTNMALALVAMGKNDEAIAQYLDALQIAPDNYVIQMNLGYALSRVGRLDEAISRFQEAIRLKEDFVEAHNGLGLTLGRKGDAEGAIGEYREALRLMPTLAETHNNLGAALASQGKLAEAIGHFSEAVRLKPTFVDARNNYGVALSSQGKLDSALTQFAQAASLDPNSAKAHYGIGLVRERQGRETDAAREFNEVLRIHPNDGDALAGLERLRQGRR